MNRLGKVVLLALVAFESGCYAQSAKNESDFKPVLGNVGRKLDYRFNLLKFKMAELTDKLEDLNSKLNNYTSLTLPSSEISEPTPESSNLEAETTESPVEHENLNSSKPNNQTDTVKPSAATCQRSECRNVTVLERTFEVLYENNNDHGADWIVIQHRTDGSLDFYRNWADYRSGFGRMEAAFWLGLENIHALTSSNSYELLILLEDFNGVKKFARYGKFSIGGESEGYNLKTLESYSGTARDSLSYHRGQRFSTFDKDQDASTLNNCAESCKGAWWYKNCAYSNLNGLYQNEKGKAALHWYGFNGDMQGLKTSKMMIREV